MLGRVERELWTDRLYMCNINAEMFKGSANYFESYKKKWGVNGATERYMIQQAALSKC